MPVGWVGGMDASHLFTAALRLQSPWKVGSVGFRDADGGRQELRIMIVFEPGARFHCPETGRREDACPVHDRRGRVWRHPDFFRCKAFIHAGVPRVSCPVHGVSPVPAPWARPGGGFTLLFGAWAVEMARHLPAGTLAGLVEHDVVNVTPGRDPATVERFSRGFMDHNGVLEYVVF